MEFYLDGEVPSKKNSRIITKSRKLIPSSTFTRWHSDALLMLRAQASGIKPCSSPIKVAVEFHHADKVRRDSDNQLSSVLDLLQDAGIIENDCWQIVMEISVANFMAKDKKPCCKICINDYNMRGTKND